METYERIKSLRIDRDISQKEVAEALNTTRQQIYKYESGQQEMTLSKLKALCEFFHVSADYILDLPKHLYWPR
jgi:transcriptional regulator with XRE-family HTH domain